MNFAVIQAAVEGTGAGQELLAIVPWAALVTAAVSLLVAFSRHYAEARNRRRDIYSQAYRTALEWVEMVYRVRRRSAGTEGDLVQRAHDIQERIAYYEGWLASESMALSNSYCRLVEAIKDQTAPMIAAAWQEAVRPVAQQTRTDDEHPTVAGVSAEFLRDVRAHLSFQPWRRSLLWWRRRGWPGVIKWWSRQTGPKGAK